MMNKTCSYTNNMHTFIPIHEILNKMNNLLPILLEQVLIKLAHV